MVTLMEYIVIQIISIGPMEDVHHIIIHLNIAMMEEIVVENWLIHGHVEILITSKIQK